jgi:hypothetical protein
MLYRFKSKNLADVIMLEPNGKRVLEIIGKDPGPQGIILPDQMPSAVEALRLAIEREERDMAQTREAAKEGRAEEHPADAVSLRQRSLPFIQMLQFCHQHGDTVVWGV